MGWFHKHDDEPDPAAAARLATGGTDGRFQVLDEDGKPVWYSPDDFDEIFTTTDEHEAGRHVKIGWLLLDEAIGPAPGPGPIEFEQRIVPSDWGSGMGTGFGGMSKRTVPVERDPGDVTTYVLGYLKPGRTGQPS